MVSISDSAVIIVLVLCSIALATVAFLVAFWCWRRHREEALLLSAQGRGGQQSSSNCLVMSPSPGTYKAPLEVRCDSAGTAYETIFVHVTLGAHKEAGFTAFIDPIVLSVPGKYIFSVFGTTADGDETAIERYEFEIIPEDGLMGLKPPPGTYTAPLELDASDAFRTSAYVAVHPTYPKASSDFRFRLNVSGVHVVLVGSSHKQAEHDEARHVYTLLPPAPVITPNSEDSEITDSTQIFISPADPYVDPESTIRYSIDGSYPTVPYIGPFYPPGVQTLGARMMVVVKAIAIGRDGTTSAVVTANFAVLSSGCSVFDPSVPEPSCVVSAADPYFTFEHPGFAKGEPIIIFYAIGPGADPKQWTLGQKVKMPGSAVLEMRAWAVHAATGAKSAEATYTASRYAMADPATGNLKKGKGSGGKAAGASKNAAAGRRQEAQAENNTAPAPAATLESPSIVCSCSAVELRFDPPPMDSYVLRYSLNGTQPDETSPHYAEGSVVDITNEVAMNGGQVYIVARYFCRDEPRPGQPLHVAPVTRFGNSFSRLFSIL